MYVLFSPNQENTEVSYAFDHDLDGTGHGLINKVVC